MKVRQHVSLLAIVGLALCSACAGTEEEREESKLAGVESSTNYDLGGPCLGKDPSRQMPATFLRESELRDAGNWDALIDAMKELVRDDCSIPYRWGQLLDALADGGRHAEAVSVAEEMTRRGFPPPHAFLSRSNPSFLASEEFRDSSLGIAYAAREIEIQEIVRQAELALASMDQKDLPPKIYRNVGACPFECCTYRRWKTEKPVRLQESIESPAAVADIPADSNVVGVTGEVRVEPKPYAVLEDNGQILKAGDIIFFLDNEGEGYVNYWYKGMLKPDLGLDDGLLLYTDDTCMPGTQKWACSLRQLRPGKKFLNEWWVKIRTSDGKEGWVLNTGQFSNVDACG